MSYQGNLTEDQIVDFTFTTRNSSGVPTTLAGTPVLSVYKANGTTQSTAGITLTVDFDSLTGLNQVRIDTSAAAFYAPGNDYSVVITTGTVGGSSVVGVTVATFSIQNRFANAVQIADAVWTEILADHEGVSGATAEALSKILADVINKKKADHATGKTTVYKSDGITEYFARTTQQGPGPNEVELVPA